MSQVSIGGKEFDILKMTPREQAHMLRRVTPLMAAVGSGALGLLDDTKSKGEVMSGLLETIGPLSEVLADMKDEQFDYIMDSALVHVRILDIDQKWHPIYVRQPRGATRMYTTIDLATELRLVAEVIKVNLSGFFGQLSDDAESQPSSLSAPLAASN